VARRKDEEYRLPGSGKEHKIGDLLKQIGELKRAGRAGKPAKRRGRFKNLNLRKSESRIPSRCDLKESPREFAAPIACRRCHAGGASCGKIPFGSPKGEELEQCMGG